MNDSNNPAQNINDASLSTRWSDDEWETDSDRENELDRKISQTLKSQGEVC